jgi:membrane protease YdiL (CAAX protease family)
VIILLVVLGALAQIWAWRLVAVRFLSIWTGSVTALAACGIAAIITDRISLSPKVSILVATVAGIAAGFALYAATRIFLLEVRSPQLQRASEEIYEQQRSLSTPTAVLISLALAVPGEELFWRGLFQGRASQTFGAFGGALATWIGYLVVNASSGFLALVMGAAVGGAVWGGLAWWTQGVLAPILCAGDPTAARSRDARPPRGSPLLPRVRASGRTARHAGGVRAHRRPPVGDHRAAVRQGEDVASRRSGGRPGPGR